MAEQSKQGTYTGRLPSVKTGSGKGSARSVTTPPPLGTRVLPVSKIAPMEAASKNTGETPAALLAILVALKDYQEVMRQCPQSWITSSKGKIYMCIEAVGGRLVLVNGVPHLDGVPVSAILEKSEVPTEQK